MKPYADDPLVDGEAGRLVRPYTVSNGRTKPSAQFDLLTLVRATDRRPSGYLGPDHSRVLKLCSTGAVSVAEIAAQIAQPAVVTKVLLSDLVDCGAITSRAPRGQLTNDATDRELLEAVLDGLQRL